MAIFLIVSWSRKLLTSEVEKNRTIADKAKQPTKANKKKGPTMKRKKRTTEKGACKTKKRT